MRTGGPLCRILLLYFFAAGCGGSGSNNGPSIEFSSGLHSLRAEAPGDPSTTNFELVGSLVASGSTISGIMHFMSSSCFPFSTDISVTGIVRSSEIELTSTLPNGQKVVFTGLTHPGGHPQFLAGNYAVTSAGCLTAVQGLAADEALNFGGAWTGSITSAAGKSGRVNLTLTQTGPDAHGLFSATGTATISGATCFASATVDSTSLLLGDGSTLVLDDAAPSSTGKTVMMGNFFPPSPVGFGGMSGTYTSHEGACSDTGSFSLTE